MQTMLGFIGTATWGERYGGHIIQTENEMLEIPDMTKADLQDVVYRLAERNHYVREIEESPASWL